MDQTATTATPPPTAPDGHMTMREASAALGIPINTAYAWAKAGRLETRTVPLGEYGHSVFVTIASVQAMRAALLARGGVRPGPGSPKRIPENLTHRIVVRASQSDHDAWCAAASAVGVYPSTFLRNTINAALGRPVEESGVRSPSAPVAALWGSGAPRPRGGRKARART